MSGLSRRQFVLSTGAAGLGLLAGCGRLPWQAEQPVKSTRIGWLILTSPTAERDALVEQLRQFGYVAGQNLVIEYRLAEGMSERLPGFAAELVALPVDLIIASGTQAIQVAVQATSTIPIVSISSDPVGTGLVASLARPAGNVTGVSLMGPQLAGKRLELLKTVAPEMSRVAVLWNPADPPREIEFRETGVAAQELGLQLQSVEVRAANLDLGAVLDAATAVVPDALIVLQDPLLNTYRAQIVGLAANRQLPDMYTQRLDAGVGGLMSYGPSRAGLYRRAAYYVDRILKGAKPADLPVEQPMTFEFVVNMKTAQALGITFPHEIMLQVTEVIDQ